MEYNQLGKTELKISRIGFGGMSLKSDQANASTIIDAAVDGGINYFDTADIYENGANEILFGKLLKTHRNKVIIATKVGNQMRKDGSGLDWNPNKTYIIKAVEDSLRRLQTDCIQVYQLHGGTINDPIDETIDAFETLKKAGKIQHYGISSIRPNVIREYLQKSSIESVMMQYSLLDRRPEEACLSLLEQNKVSLLARGTLASGLLINKPAKDYLDLKATDVEKITAKIKVMANSYQIEPASIAIGYVLKHAATAATVIGIRTPQQLQQALLAEEEKLTDEAYKELQNFCEANNYADHR